VVEPGLPHRRDDDPVAGQVDGVAVALIHGRHLAAQEGPVERVLGSLALDRHEESGEWPRTSLLGLSPGSVARPRADSSLGRVDPPKGRGEVAPQGVDRGARRRGHQRGEPRVAG
jgi:hypothetical protein